MKPSDPTAAIIDKSPTPPQTPPPRRRVGVAVVCLVVLVASVYFARQHFHDAALEHRLTGTWASDYVRDDETVGTFVWKFLADGTMRHHLEGQPVPETGSVDDYMWWHVSDGHLVLTFDRRFLQDVSLRSKTNAAIRYLRQVATGTNLPAETRDVCIMRDVAGGSIELSLDPSENSHDSWFGDGVSVLTRIPDVTTK